jgi:hypothetical protein
MPHMPCPEPYSNLSPATHVPHLGRTRQTQHVRHTAPLCRRLLQCKRRCCMSEQASHNLKPSNTPDRQQQQQKLLQLPSSRSCHRHTHTCAGAAASSLRHQTQSAKSITPKQTAVLVVLLPHTHVRCLHWHACMVPPLLLCRTSQDPSSSKTVQQMRHQLLLLLPGPACRRCCCCCSAYWGGR